MSIFDKFRKSRKIITEVVEKELEENDGKKKATTHTEELSEIDKQKEQTEQKIRNVAKQYLPGEASSEYTIRENARFIADFFDMPEENKKNLEDIFDKVHAGEITLANGAALSANSANLFLDEEKIQILAEKAGRNENDALLKLWVAVDLCICTSAETENLKVLKNKCSDIISEKCICEEEIEEAKSFLVLEKECGELKKDDEKKEMYREKRQELKTRLLNKKTLFVLYDNDFKEGFPFIGLHGRIEVLSRYETAVALKKHYEKENMGHVFVKRVEKSDYDKFFKTMAHIGVPFVNLDNGTFPMIFMLSELADGGFPNVTERFNCAMRGLFVRSEQYSARVAKASKEIKGTEKEKAMLEAMLTTRFNAYREFGNSVVYVFVNTPYEKGKTLYTKKALDRANVLCRAVKLTEKSLIAPGDGEYGIYDGTLNLRVTHKEEDTSMENSYVCVFTSRVEAERVRLHFERFGCNDSVVAVTYEELCGQLSNCAGVILDMSLYGLSLGKKELEEVERWKKVKEKIVVNLKKKSDDEKETENKENGETDNDGKQKISE